MADGTLTGLIALIGSAESIELRRAAVRVAKAFGLNKNHALNQALLTALDDSDVELRILAIEALGKNRADVALPTLVRFVQSGGPEVESSVIAIGQLGVRGTKALGKVMHSAVPTLRRRIAAALALAGTESAVLATVESLLDDDAGVVGASAKSLAAEVPSLTRGQKRVLTEHLLELVRPKVARGKPAKSAAGTSGISPSSEAAILRVLAALHAPEADEIYWDRLDPTYPTASRSASLQALASLPLSDSQSKLAKLYRCAADADFQVVAPALMLLKKIPASRKNVGQWLALFDAPDVAAHALAVEKLREIDTPAVAKGLLKQLQHPDKSLRDAALAALGELKCGRDALFAALLDAKNAQESWTLARTQQNTAPKWSSGQRAKVFSEACKLHDSDDRRADALWFVLAGANHEDMRTKVEQRALALRGKKKFAASLSYWRLLTRDPAVGAGLRFQVAATGLKLSAHDSGANAREADPALEQFSRLLQDPSFDLLAEARGAKWLDENDLFYLGFHFSEQQRLAREFGSQILQHVIKRWPKSQAARNAKQKLKSEGLG